MRRSSVRFLGTLDELDLLASERLRPCSDDEFVRLNERLVMVVRGNHIPCLATGVDGDVTPVFFNPSFAVFARHIPELGCGRAPSTISRRIHRFKQRPDQAPGPRC